MRLPYGSAARYEQVNRKVTAYALNINHSSGRHKAKLFKARLGITIENREVLIKALLNEAKTGNAIYTKASQYGRHYLIDFSLTTELGTSNIRSA